MPLPTHVSATPAYGRDYRSQAALRADWNEGKDFRLHVPGAGSAPYFSIRDLPRLLADGVRCINFRYARNTRVLPIQLASEASLSELPLSDARRSNEENKHGC